MKVAWYTKSAEVHVRQAVGRRAKMRTAVQCVLKVVIVPMELFFRMGSVSRDKSALARSGALKCLQDMS